jgi:hypothetical protein
VSDQLEVTPCSIANELQLAVAGELRRIRIVDSMKQKRLESSAMEAEEPKHGVQVAEHH